MDPAASIIIFTTASGAGYGLLAILGFMAALDVSPTPGPFAVALALGLISIGLFASTFHLGRPLRAWRALSRWRTSWMSREGLAALVTFLPATAFGVLWASSEPNDVSIRLLGGLSAAMAMTTVFCTAMIYASLTTIRRWSHTLVPPIYLALALQSGALLLVALTTVFGGRGPIALAMATTFAAWLIKAAYWRSIDRALPTSSLGSATGLAHLGAARAFDPPHTGANFLLRDMGFVVSRKRALALRRSVHVCLFGAPFALIGLILLTPLSASCPLASTAILAAAIGLGTERWLFFAEARHVSALFYGRVD